ncbi:hypothetical protein BGZ65_001627, partial [Modicella reniformis]
MTASARLYLTLTVALGLLASASASVAEVVPVPAVAVAEPVAQDPVFDYSQYKSPPIWSGVQPYDEQDVPINFRRGGARGGDIHGRRRRSIAKREVIYDKNPHLLGKTFKDWNLVNAQVDTKIDSTLTLEKRFVKRADDDEKDYEFMEINGIDPESLEVYNNGDEVDEEDVDDEDEEEEEEQEQEQDEDEDEDEDEEEEDEDEDEEGSDEAGLQDWIEEMKSEEYFDLAGSDRMGLDDVQEQQDQLLDEDKD